MEGCQEFIQAIDKLDSVTKKSIIQGFCQAAIQQFKFSKEEAIKLLTIGGTYTIIGIKILDLMGITLPFNQLIEVCQYLEDTFEVFNIAFLHHPKLFTTKVLENTYKYPISTQQIILDVVEASSVPGLEILESLKTAVSNLKKYWEEKLEQSLAIHHKTISVILLRTPHTAAEYVHSLCDGMESLSGSLIHYVSVLTAEYFNDEVLNKLETELLDNDLSVRKKAALLLKKALSFSRKDNNEWNAFWEIFESLENYNKNLVAASWKRVYSLFSWDIQKVIILFRRASAHENLTVRRYIAKNFMKQNGSHTTFALTTFIEYLSDPGLYSDSIELVGRSKFGQTISSFFINLLKNSSNKIEDTRTFILNSFEKIEFQVSFRYIIEIIYAMYEDNLITPEILEKSIQITYKQITQQTPYNRNQSILLLKRFAETSLTENLILKVKLANRLKVHCSIKLDITEAASLLEDCIENLIQSKPTQLTHEEIGILFACSFSSQSIKALMPLFQTLQSIYRNTYLKLEVINTWVQVFYSIVKQLNVVHESLSQYLLPLIDEIFSYSLSVTEASLVKILGKSIYHCLKNIGISSTYWALSKLNVLKGQLPKSSIISTYSIIYYIYKILKYGVNAVPQDFLNPCKGIEFLLIDFDERKQAARDILHLITPLKWKTLALVSIYDTSIVSFKAAEMLENCSLNMIESILFILKRGFITNASEQEIEDISKRAWNLILETKNDAPLSIPISYMQFAFNINTIRLAYTPELLLLVLKTGKERWGIVRALLSECIPIWVQNPITVTPYVDSVYELAIYEESRSDDTDFLISCVFALINTPKPHIKGDSSSLKSQYVRISVLFMIKKVYSNHKFIESLLEKCSEGLVEACKDRGEFPNSLVYKNKIRLAQLLCCLCQWVKDQAKKETVIKVVKDLIELLKIPYVHSARHYIERFLISVMTKYSELTEFIVLDYDMKPQLAGSFLLVLGSVMVFTDIEKIRLKSFEDLLPFMISNTAHIRRVTHFVMFRLIQAYPEYRQKSAIFDFLFKNKECIKMMNRLESLIISFNSLKDCNLEYILTGSFSEFDEILHPSLVSEIDEKTKNLLDTSYEFNYNDLWRVKADEISMDYIKSPPNFQRKVEDTPALIELHTTKGVQQRHELIIVASLVDKIPNLAGLTRTSEVFNLQMITVAFKNVLNESEFKSMAVTADKWIPIMEVPKTDLEKFLRLYRHNKYQIIGLEQTANSVALEKYRFASKTVLVLGHEKDGIPGELLPLMDNCVEIPQFGLIRSLNVHVSGSICIWEYIKQLYLKFNTI